MALRVSWTGRAKDRLRMNLERIVSQGISANDRTKPEEAIVQILKDGKVEETKTAQKYGNFV